MELNAGAVVLVNIGGKCCSRLGASRSTAALASGFNSTSISGLSIE